MFYSVICEINTSIISMVVVYMGHPRGTRKTKQSKQTKQAKQTTNRKKKETIVDPDFSHQLHKGTQASSHCALCERDYHYQSYETYIHFVKLLVAKKKLSYVYVPDDFSIMSLELDMKHATLEPLYTSKANFSKHLKEGIKHSRVSMVPIILNLSLGKDDNHANCLVVNKKTKVIELFEPHGHRDSISMLGNKEGGYVKKIRTLKHYWKSQLPEYTVSNVVDYVDRTAFQVEYDPEESSGYCVTWSLLYMNYRLINPDVAEEPLIHHIDKTINTQKLLKYARQVESEIKGG